jgi:hypothetical protein
MEDVFSALPADALVTLMLALPLDERARCAVLARRFRDLLCPRGGKAHVALRRRLDFSGCTAKVSAATLKSLVLRCGDELRVLNINAPCCDNIALLDAISALKALRPSSVEEVDLREPLDEVIFDSMVRQAQRARGGTAIAADLATSAGLQRRGECKAHVQHVKCSPAACRVPCAPRRGVHYHCAAAAAEAGSAAAAGRASAGWCGVHNHAVRAAESAGVGARARQCWSARGSVLPAGSFWRARCLRGGRDR